MKKYTLSKLFLGAALVGLVFTSCNDKSDSKNSETSATTTGTTTSSESTPESGEEVKLNPAHGLPGHRCELPVGAPLPSGSDTTATPTPTQTQTQGNPNVSPIRVNKNPAINPPHGEPGHDCAVPVGAPLE